MNSSSEKMNPSTINFIEFTAAHYTDVEPLMENTGFVKTFHNADHTVVMYQQGEMTMIVNTLSEVPAFYYRVNHGVCISGVGVTVNDQRGFLSQCDQVQTGYGLLPKLAGIGGVSFYLSQADTLDQIKRRFIATGQQPKALLTHIDHIAFNVFRGRSEYWEDQLMNRFHLKKLMKFDIAGKYTTFTSRALINEQESLRCVISESDDNSSQIADYLQQHRGEGIQHIAFATDHITQAVSSINENNIGFVQIPDEYYRELAQCRAIDSEELAKLKQHNILVDSGGAHNKELLLQTFSKNVLGPFFIEIIQRKGSKGFGESNITSLFEAVEREQLANGTLSVS